MGIRELHTVFMTLLGILVFDGLAGITAKSPPVPLGTCAVAAYKDRKTFAGMDLLSGVCMPL